MTQPSFRLLGQLALGDQVAGCRIPTGELDAGGFTEVITYLPYFRLQDERYAEATIAQMLSHTSGTPDTEGYGRDRPECDDGALERYVRGLAGLSLIAPPVERFAYSNIAL